MKSKNFKKYITIIITAIIFFMIGYFLNIEFKNNNRVEALNNHDFSLFWDVWGTIEKKYPFEEPSEYDKKYGAIKGLVSSYNDDYSMFFSPSDSKQFQENVNGKFGGVGMEVVNYKGYLMVITPLKDSPAEKSGILPGDIITRIDDVETYNKNINKLISLIRGDIGTEVNLTIIRANEDEPIKITVVRDIIKIPVLDTKIIDDVFVIFLYNFNKDSEDNFKKALVEFKNSGLKKILIDLRNNPGGYMSSSINIASYFLEQGKIVLKEDFGDNDNNQNIYRSKGFKLLDGLEYDLAILINKGSASASEILAGALQDNDKAIIIGEQSFGKGSVQELINLKEGTSLKVTIAKWMTPDGNQISKHGITPDFSIDDIKDYDKFTEEALKIFNKQNK